MRRGQCFPWHRSHQQQDNYLLLALEPREKKEAGYANNNFFLGRAAVCTGRKFVTLGREQQHAAQPDAWLGFPSIFLFGITNILQFRLSVGGVRLCSVEFPSIEGFFLFNMTGV